MISRRSAASLLAGLPFVGGSAAKSAGQLQGVTLGMAGTQSGPPQQPYPNTAPTGPKMPEWRATRLAMADPDIRALLVAAAYAQNRVVTSVDPDIEVMRSFSPMAKITFQRQRNVQRMLDQAIEEPVWSFAQKAHDFIRKIMWGS